MEEDLARRLEALERKLDATFASAEKMRKYFQIILIVTVVAFVLPLMGLIFAVPTFLSTYQGIATM